MEVRRAPDAFVTKNLHEKVNEKITRSRIMKTRGSDSRTLILFFWNRMPIFHEFSIDFEEPHNRVLNINRQSLHSRTVAILCWRRHTVVPGEPVAVQRSVVYQRREVLPVLFSSRVFQLFSFQTLERRERWTTKGYERTGKSTNNEFSFPRLVVIFVLLSSRPWPFVQRFLYSN